MKSTHKHISNTHQDPSGLLDQRSELQFGTDKNHDSDCAEKLAEVLVLHNSSSNKLQALHNCGSKPKCSKPKKAVKRSTDLKHKVPSSKLIASCTKHRHTHKFKDWNWTPVISLTVNGKTLVALVDSGASHSLMATGKLKVTPTKIKSKTVQSIWKTCGSSSYLTNSTAKLDFKLPEFTNTRMVLWNFYEAKSAKSLNGYDCIIGRDLLKKLNIIINFK